MSPDDARAVVTPRRAGRPRSEATDGAILDAALRLLTEQGYARMTMDGVAAEAGVSKATIYLRYRGKADLATAALAHLRESDPPARSGRVRDDLLGLLTQLRANADRFSVMALVGTCLVEQQHTPELLTLFRERTVGPRRESVAAILEEGIRRGELPPHVDVGATVDLLMGAYHARCLSGEPFPDDWERRIVDALVPGGAA